MRNTLLAAGFAALPVLLSSPAPARSPAFKPAALVGVWQAAPAMGAGWAETYRFFPDGSFRHHTSQFDAESRLREESGGWKALDGGRLRLSVRSETVWVGGTKEPALGSVGSEFEIVGAMEKRRSLVRLRVQVVPFSLVGPDRRNRRDALTLGKTRLWRFSGDPKRYP